MGLVIKQTENKKIKIQGTDIELPSVYGRIEFAGRADGVTLEINIATYASKEAYKQGANILSTDVAQGNLSIQLVGDEKQDIDTSHKYAKLAMEQFGYEVEI